MKDKSEAPNISSKIKTYQDFIKASDEAFRKAGISTPIGEIDWSKEEGYGVIFTGAKQDTPKKKK